MIELRIVHWKFSLRISSVIRSPSLSTLTVRLKIWWLTPLATWAFLDKKWPLRSVPLKFLLIAYSNYTKSTAVPPIWQQTLWLWLTPSQCWWENPKLWVSPWGPTILKQSQRLFLTFKVIKSLWAFRGWNQSITLLKSLNMNKGPSSANRLISWCIRRILLKLTLVSTSSRFQLMMGSYTTSLNSIFKLFKLMLTQLTLPYAQ